MQRQMEEGQKELETKEFTATAGGGAVEVTVSGKKEVVRVKLSEEVVDPDDIEMLQDYVKDAELKHQLRRLAEAVRYSDPMKTDAIADVDARITQETFALRTYCEDGDVESAKASCAKLQRLYVERNKKLLASK